MAALTRRTSSNTSLSVVIPRSGQPYDAQATPLPDRYSARNPADAARIAVYALTAPTICKGRSASTAARKRAPAEA